MVAEKYGKADINEQTNPKTAKEKTDKPMLRASAKTAYTGLMGGPSNKAAMKKGGKVRRR